MLGIVTIRGFTPAAPLKPAPPPSTQVGSDNYPRVHTRGPIEAASLRPRLALFHSAIRGFTPAAPLKPRTRRPTSRQGRRYPRVHTRGPIEATHNEQFEHTSRRYPRVHTRGPIEARSLCAALVGEGSLSAGSHPRPH